MSSEIFESISEDFRNICQNSKKKLDEIRNLTAGGD